MSGFSYKRICTPRRMRIDYIAPPICEGDFTSTGVVTISLLPIEPDLGPTGLVMEWTGSLWRLRWNTIPGALCYTVYRLADVLDPFSQWIVVAECIQETEIDLDDLNNQNYSVTGITPDGETDPSEIINTPAEHPGGGPVYNIIVEGCAEVSQASVDSFPRSFRITRDGLLGETTVNFVLGGGATNGTEYALIPSSAVIPNGQDFVDVVITPDETNLTVLTDVTLTLSESVSYIVSSPSAAVIVLRPALFKITGYGDSEPLFDPNPISITPEDSGYEACEWDGVFTLNSPVSSWQYEDGNGEVVFGGAFNFRAAIQGKQMYRARIVKLGSDFFMEVVSAQGGFAGLDVWVGQKVGGATAAGVYNRLAGFDTRASITVEAVP